MTRIVSDANGVYDLAQVVAITKIESNVNGPGGVRVPGPTTAKLHYPGTGHSTLLDYDLTREAWLATKDAEGHPVDRPMFSGGHPDNEEKPS